jgi:hypothetical protein
LRKAEPNDAPDDVLVAPKRAKPVVKPILKGYQRVAQLLERKGYRCIGQGAYSTVFAHADDPDWIIKLNREVDLWPSYIKWAKEHGYEGKFVPEVSALRTMNAKTKPFYIAKVKRLQTTLSDSADREPKHLVQYLANDLREDADTDWEKSIQSYKQQLADSRQEGITKFVQDFYANFSGHRLDLHGGNWMLDQHNKVYLTDPITGLSHCSTQKAKSEAQTQSCSYRCKSQAPVFVSSKSTRK